MTGWPIEYVKSLPTNDINMLIGYMNYKVEKVEKDRERQKMKAEAKRLASKRF